MSVEMEYQTDVDANNLTLRDPIDSIRIQCDAATTLFNELKQSATFIYDLGTKFGFSSKDIDELKAKIDSLFISINVSIVEASERIINELSKTAEVLTPPQKDKSRVSDVATQELTSRISYDELYQKYNESLNKNVDLTAQLALLSEQYSQLYEQNSMLSRQMEEMSNEKQALEQRLQKAQDSLDAVEQAKENQPEPLPVAESLDSSKNLLFSSSVAGQPSAQSEDLLQKTKTADDFIEVFEKVFRSSDELVQLVKYISQGNEKKNDPRYAYITKALEKSRHLRQVINDILIVFRKARINPSVLGEDVSAQVAEELKRIYDTLKSVKFSAEKHH